jgi:hypothetical protein
MSHNRPQIAGLSTVTTPAAAELINLIGPGLRLHDVTLNGDELSALRRLYGYKVEQPAERPPKPVQKPYLPGCTSRERLVADEAYQRELGQWERWTDPQDMLQGGADRNMSRYAAQDGLRILAWLARHVEPGEDPLKTVIQMAIDSGWDVPPADVDFADGSSNAMPE